MKSFEQIARVMFYAFGSSKGWDYAEGVFDELCQSERQAWVDAAKAAHKEIMEIQ